MNSIRLAFFQVDAFAEVTLMGNPAAVVPLQQWLPNSTLQAIAEENNLSETAFFVRDGSHFNLRWFTPLAEVDLCGHATLAAAHVLCKHSGATMVDVEFHTRSGVLRVKNRETHYELDLPSVPVTACELPTALSDGLGCIPKQVFRGMDYLVVLDSEEQVQALQPDFSRWLNLDARGVVVTALRSDGDFVSRCFYPKLGINEDPVTGSAHCQLAPLWQAKTGQSSFFAQQLSKRGGSLECEVRGDRVLLRGKAATYLIGAITIPV